MVGLQLLSCTVGLLNVLFNVSLDVLLAVSAPTTCIIFIILAPITKGLEMINIDRYCGGGGQHPFHREGCHRLRHLSLSLYVVEGRKGAPCVCTRLVQLYLAVGSLCVLRVLFCTIKQQVLSFWIVLRSMMSAGRKNGGDTIITKKIACHLEEVMLERYEPN